jgi:hypothetical protein
MRRCYTLAQATGLAGRWRTPGFYSIGRLQITSTLEVRSVLQANLFRSQRGLKRPYQMRNAPLLFSIVGTATATAFCFI